MKNKTAEAFYNSNPYPNVSNFVKLKLPDNFIENAFNLVKKPIKANPSILIVGCGTEAPSIIGQAYPNSSIVALDISEETVKLAKKKCSSELKSKITFKCLDLADNTIVNALEGREFDFIHCTGVLQQLETPIDGINNLSRLLAKDGVIRFQVYSKGARIWIEWARNLFTSKKASKASDVKEILMALSRYHPFRFVLSTYPEALRHAGLNDAFLNPVVNTYYADEWDRFFRQCGLGIVHWDKTNLINDIENILPKRFLDDFNQKSIPDKITFMEKIGEYRADFSGIITKLDNNILIKPENSAINQEYIISSAENISYPREFLWKIFKESVNKLNYDLDKQDIIYILDNLSERSYTSGVTGLLMRLKWSCWKDECRKFASQACFFEEKKGELVEDYFDNSGKSVYVPSADTWLWEQWQNGFFAWEW